MDAESDKRMRSASGHTPGRSPSKPEYSDRFIPSRSASKLSASWMDATAASTSSPSQPSEREDSAAAYSLLLRSELLGAENVGGAGSHGALDKQSASGGSQVVNTYSPQRNILRFKYGENGLAGRPIESPYCLSPVGADGPLGTTLASPRRSPRKIPRSPFKVLDAPALQDDFYLNLVDWSSHNVLAVGLGTCVYLWSACTSKVTKLCDLGPNDSVCSVGWTQRGTYLAVGTNSGEVQIWDAARCKKIRGMGGHHTRVGTLAWNSHTLSSGSRDRNILQRDVRVQGDYVSKLVGHKSEVCGLKWSYDDRELASGGNDNQLYIWNMHSTSPVLRYSEHSAAVKAISWSPHQHGLLASGGGTADRCVRFWNTSTNSALQCVDTGSQVCNLVWSKNVNELVSTHGYSQNQIIVWRYPTMTKLATLTGHTLRVLYLAISPDGQTIVTGAGDETLRFWNVFPGPKSQGSVHDSTGAVGLGQPLVLWHGSIARSPEHVKDALRLCGAVQDGEAEAVRRMLDGGMRADASTYDGRTALHVAAADGALAMVELLVDEYGAFVSPADRWQSTPLTEARRFGHADVVAYLTEHGGLDLGGEGG